MIEKIQLRGFGNHKKLDVQLGRITTITGSNFRGKSTIIRALEWAGRNEPVGSQFINWDSDTAAVRVVFDGGKKVIRKKGKSINLYKYQEETKTKKFVSFENNVPPIIQQALNISELNFQNQQDAAFWFCETAGEVSRQLNKIVNLDIIDKTQSNLISQQRKQNIQIDLIQKQLKKAIIEKAGLKYVKQLNKDFTHIEELEANLQAKALTCRRIDELIESARIYNQKLCKGLEWRQGAKNRLSIGHKWRVIAKSTKTLFDLVNEASRLNIITEIKIPSIKPITKLKLRLEAVSIRIEKLTAFIKAAETERELKCQVQEKLKRIKTKLRQVAGEVCPLCGSLMTKK